MSIEVRCPSCQKRYAVPDELAGRKAQCQACGQVINVPTAAAVAQATAMSDLLDEELDVAAMSAEASQKKCPACGKSVAAESVLCIDCGYDFNKGKVLKTKKDRPDKPEAVSGMPGLPAQKKKRGPKTFSPSDKSQLRVVRVGLELTFWALIAEYSLIGLMFFNAVAGVLAPLFGLAFALGNMAAMKIALLVFVGGNLIGLLLCLWVPRSSGAKGKVIAVVVMNAIYLSSPVWFLAFATQSDDGSLVAVILAGAVVLLPVIATFVFLSFLRSLALYFKRTDLSDTVDSIVVALIACTIGLIMLAVLMPFLSMLAAPTGRKLLGLLSALLILVVFGRLLIALYQYGEVLWKLKGAIAKRV